MSERVARLLVCGVGLIGGSFALALRRANLVGEVVGLGRTAANLGEALRRGIVDRVADDPTAAATADLILLATPVGACADAARALAVHARPGTLCTDVASVKGALVTTLEATWAAVGPFVGGHPIAGSDAAGAGAARADLFAGRRCVLTPTRRTDGAALARVRRLWEATGAHVEVMPPDVHDAILARVSHLPHALAYALVAAVAPAAVDGRDVLAYAGSGFLDTTRIAGSSPELWRDILVANAPAVGAAAAEFRAVLDALIAHVAAGDGAGIERILVRAAAARRGMGGAA